MAVLGEERVVRIGLDGGNEAASFDPDRIPSADGRWSVARDGERLEVRPSGGGAALLAARYPQGFGAIGWSDDSRFLSFRTGPIESGGPCAGDGPLGP